MKSLPTAIVTIVLLAGLPFAALAAERLSDKQVKATAENIDRGFDKWKDSLERRNLDDAVIRSAAGTIDVRRFLDDFEKDIREVKDRVKPDYPADAEVTALLRRASDIERRARAGGQATPAPEWQAMSSELSSLASAYGTTFPLPTAEATAARFTDTDVAKRLEEMEQQSKRVVSEANKALKQKKASDAERDRTTQAMNALAAAAKQTRAMVKAGTATGAQATALLASATSAKQLVAGLSMAAPGATGWAAIDRHAGALAKAFGLSW